MSSWSKDCSLCLHNNFRVGISPPLLMAPIEGCNLVNQMVNSGLLKPARRFLTRATLKAPLGG